MKNKVFKYISFFAALLLIMGACEKTDIQKANDDYDFGKVIPVVQGITGPANATQTFSESFSPNYYRGGSIFSWSTSSGAAITSTSTDTRDIDVLFSEMGDVTLTLTETTLGGVTSEPYELDIQVAEFCPMTRDDFLGTWVGTETGDSEVDPLSVTFIAGTGADEIVAEVSAGIPAFMSGVFIGWGEAFQVGIGPEGDITLVVNTNGSISIGETLTYWGQTLPGPYDYWYNGGGLWSGCGTAPTMVFTFNLDYNGDGVSTNRTSEVSLTKQ